MSEENVEIVRALYEAWNGPDGARGALAFIADDFECFTTLPAKTSPDGVTFSQDEAHLWTLRDGKAVRLGGSTIAVKLLKRRGSRSSGVGERGGGQPGH
jgi:ketosteroid isomerase-like protein